MKWRQALLAVFLVSLVVGSGFAGATALGAPVQAHDQQTASVEQTVTHPASENVRELENESNSSGPTVGEDWTPPEDKEKSNVSSQLRQQLDANQSGPAVGGDSLGSDGAPSTVEIVVEASPGQADLATDVVTRAGGKVTARHGDLVQVRVPESAVHGIATSPAIEFARLPIRPSANEVTSQGVETMNATWAHDRNITGENVTVAVIDLEGFNLKNDEIGVQVVDHKDFTGAGIGNGSSELHGTAVAELVADTAPDASLVTLRASSLVEWHNAVDYVREETDTDVVVMSMSYYGVGPLDGTSEMNQEISSLRDHGVLWVNSAGNAANGEHWNGTWSDPNEDGWMNFTADDQWLRLDSGTEANIVVNWNDWENTNEDYDLYILDDSGNIVGKSTNAQNDDQDRPIEWYVNTSVDGPLYLGIYNADANGNSDFDIWFRGDLTPEYWTAQRSVTNPGVGPDALTVGAVYYSDSTIEGFSSRGPTIDGRLKPDLVAPDGVDTTAYSGAFYGTSAAAPHAAGVAALLADVNKTISPTHIESALLDTAIHVNGTEPDTTYGHGLADAEGAIQTQPPVATLSTTDVDYGTIHLTRNESQNVSIVNDGGRPLNITQTEFSGDDPAAFTVTGGGNGTVGQGESHDIAVEFNASNRGAQSATLTIDHNGTDGHHSVSLAGETVAPDVSVTPSEELDFGTISLRDGEANASVTVKNTGSVPLNVTGTSVSGPNASVFTFETGGAETPSVLAPGETETYQATATIDSTGPKTGYLELAHNVSDAETVNRTLNATGADLHSPTVTNATANGTDDDPSIGRSDSVAIAVQADDESGVDTVTVDASALGAGTVTLEAQANTWFNATVSVDSENASEGSQTLPISATDGHGNANETQTDEIVVDLTNASLDIETPTTDAAQNETSLNVTGTADDSLSGIDSVSVQINDGAWTTATLTGSNWYQNLTSLSEGTYTVSVRATDEAGNVGPVRTRTVTIDRTAPVIDGASLESTTGLLPDASVPVSVTASDDALSVSSVTVDGTALANETDAWNGTVTTRPALGSHSVPVTVTDRAGNVNETTVTYSVGRNATLSAIDESRYRATPDDPGLGNATINATVDIAGENLTVGTASTNPTPDSPPNDTALAYPQIETSVSNDDIVNASVEVLVDKSKIDERYVLPETMTVWVYNGTAWNRSQATRIGETSLTVVFELQTTHFSTFAVTADVDGTPPTISERTPGDGSTITDTEPTISADFEDDRSGIDTDSVTLSVDGTEVTSGLSVSSSSFSHTPTLERGAHTVTLSVADAAGNTREESWEFTIEESSDDTSSSASSGGGGGGGGGGGQSSSSGAVGAKGVSTGVSGTQPTITISGGMPVESVGFVSEVGLDASVSIKELGGVSHYPPDGKSFVTGADITFNSGDEDDVDAVRIGIEQDRLDELGVSPSQLSINHYESQFAEWEELETTVVNTDGGVVVVEAPSVGFSNYVVFAEEATETTTATTESVTTTTEAPRTSETPTTTEEPTTTEQPPTTTEEPTDEGGPGPLLIGGIFVVVLALLAALYLTFGRE